MCRYVDYSYKTRYACFNCRKCFKPLHSSLELSSCPECKGPVTGVGHDFKPPKKSNKKQWEKAQLITEKSSWASCGCTGPGYKPQTLREAKILYKPKKGLWEK